MGALSVERLVGHAERYMADADFVGDSKVETDFVQCVWLRTNVSWSERNQLKQYFELRRRHRGFKPGQRKPTPRPDLVAAWCEWVESVNEGRQILGHCPAPHPDRPFCGKPLEGRQETCSDVCRQRYSRSRRKLPNPPSRRSRRTKTAGQRG